MSKGRPSGELTRCDNEWTEAKFRSFIKNNLRAATRKWAPIQRCKKKANVARGEYLCACCNQVVPPTIYDEDKGKRVNNIFVDHLEPIVNPKTGWVSWDETIDRMFCDSDNLQLLCGACHKIKSQAEIDIAKERRQQEKNNDKV